MQQGKITSAQILSLTFRQLDTLLQVNQQKTATDAEEEATTSSSQLETEPDKEEEEEE